MTIQKLQQERREAEVRVRVGMYGVGGESVATGALYSCIPFRMTQSTNL